MKLLSAILFSALSCGVWSALVGVMDPLQLVDIDVTTGKMTPFTELVEEFGEAQQLAATDYTRNIAYMLGYSFYDTRVTLIGYSTAGPSRGTPVINTTVDFATMGFVGVGQQVGIEPNSGTIILGGSTFQSWNKTVGVLDPRSGVVDIKSSLPASEWIDILDSPFTYDSANDCMLTMYANNDTRKDDTVCMSIFKNSTTVIHPTPSFEMLNTFNFDPKTGKVFGLGLSPNATGYPVRSAMSLDVATGEQQVLASFPEYSEMDSMATFDIDNRVLYWVGWADGQDPDNCTSVLFGFNVDSGKLVTKTSFVTFDGLPWSLLWVPDDKKSLRH
jgi:hypothetical protein